MTGFWIYQKDKFKTVPYFKEIGFVLFPFLFEYSYYGLYMWLQKDSFDKGAVDMANQVLVEAKHPELKEFAKDIISAQSKDVLQMKEWQRNQYNQ